MPVGDVMATKIVKITVMKKDASIETNALVAPLDAETALVSAFLMFATVHQTVLMDRMRIPTLHAFLE